MKLMMRMTWCATAAVALAAMGVAAHAGFDWPTVKANGDPTSGAQLEYDGEPIGADVTFLATIDRLVSHFNLMDDPKGTPGGMTATEKAAMKYEAIRANLMAGIALVKKQNPTIGAALETMLADGRLCVDFRSANAYGTCLHDSVSGTDGDRINIRIGEIPCDERTCYDPTMQELFSTLLHEGLHAVQTWTRLPAMPTDAQEAEWIKNRACNEMDAEDLDIEVMDKLIMCLDDVIGTDDMPGTIMPCPECPADSWARCIVDKLIMDHLNAGMLTPAGRAAAMRLRAILMASRADRQAVSDAWAGEKLAACLFLDGKISFAEMRNLIRTRNWRRAQQLKDLFDGIRRIRRMFSSFSGTFQQNALDDATGELIVADFPTPLDRIMDFAVIGKEGDRLVIAGAQGPNTVLLGFRDLDGDGLFEPAPEFLTVIPVPNAAIRLQPHPLEPSSVYLLMDSFFDVVVGLAIDGTGDGMPNQITPPVHPPTTMLQGMRDFAAPASGNVLYFFPMPLDGVPAFGPGDPVVLMQSSGVDSFFDIAVSIDGFTAGCFPPVFAAAQLAGDTASPVHAMSSAPIEVHSLTKDGASLGIVGLGGTGPDGFGEVEFFAPLSAGDRLELRDVASGKASMPVTVAAAPCPADLNGDGLVSAADLSELLGSWGPCPPGPCAADLTGDGTVNSFDLSIMLGTWGACP